MKTELENVKPKKIETRSFEIPAGTQVITKLGVETTFSRLSAGNIIALLLEKGTDNILKIWVVS